MTTRRKGMVVWTKKVPRAVGWFWLYIIAPGTVTVIRTWKDDRPNCKHLRHYSLEGQTMWLHVGEETANWRWYGPIKEPVGIPERRRVWSEKITNKKEK